MANSISILRFILTFLLIVFIKRQNINSLLPILSIIAGVTDYLDGFIARKLRLVSKYGAFIDHIADKIFIDTALFFLAYYNEINFEVVALNIFRDIIVTILKFKNERIYTSLLGKVKTFTFYLALSLIIVNMEIAEIAIYLSIGLSCFSGLLYLQRFWDFRSKRQHGK